MTGVEIALNAGSIAAAAGGLACIAFILRASGRDRLHDPVRVDALVKRAPMERLDKTLAK